MDSDSLCLVDAQVVIDGYRYSFFDALVGGHAIALSGWVRTEVQFYKAPDGTRVPIVLDSLIQTGTVLVEHATVLELTTVVSRISSRRLGRGELESLALVAARGYWFCTADQPAVRAMNQLGLLPRWMPLAELYPEAMTALPSVEAAKYQRAAV